MDNDHGITGELRKWASGFTGPYHRNELQLLAIADRIDKEHERLMEERADEYHKLRVYAEDCCVELPKDADGETWHIGDFTESGQLVYKMYLDVNGWSFYGLVNDIDPSIHRHYHAPTVEDVLHKLVGKAQALGCVEEEDALVAEYAAKLRYELVKDMLSCKMGWLDQLQAKVVDE